MYIRRVGFPGGANSPTVRFICPPEYQRSHCTEFYYRNFLETVTVIECDLGKNGTVHQYNRRLPSKIRKSTKGHRVVERVQEPDLLPPPRAGTNHAIQSVCERGGTS